MEDQSLPAPMGAPLRMFLRTEFFWRERPSAVSQYTLEQTQIKGQREHILKPGQQIVQLGNKVVRESSFEHTKLAQ